MRLILFSLFAIAFTVCKAQDPQIEWQNTIGGSGGDYLFSVQQTFDGGYILGGRSNSGISGDKTEGSQGDYDYWIIKLDAIGNIVWQKTIGGNGQDALSSIQQTFDNGYILAGASYSGISGDKTEGSQGRNDFWVVKLDTAGNILWQNTIGGSDYDFYPSIQQCPDGGYILGGKTYSGISGDKIEANHGSTDYWIIKLDTVGNIMWQNTIGGSGSDEFSSIGLTKDGGYIIAGSSNSGISGDKTENPQGSYDYWVIKIDSSGNIIWQNTIGGSEYDWNPSIQQCTDGSYILGGSSWSGISGDKAEAAQENDYWIIKLDSAGNIIWQNTIGGNNRDELNSICQIKNGGYILGGQSNSGVSGDKTEASQGDYDYWVIKLDSIGNIEWQNTLGGSAGDQLYSVEQTAEGGYILAGSTGSGLSGDKTEASQGGGDYWIIKISDLHEISGQFLTETSIPINGVTISLLGDDTLTAITDSAGMYAFGVAPGTNYTLTVYKNNDVSTSNGVTAIDLLLTRRHILGTPLNTPYKIIAADVDSSGSVSTLDVLQMQSLILQNTSTFPNGRLWAFVPSSHVFADPLAPFPYPSSRTYTNIQQSFTNQDFIGIKLGDVNNSWDPNIQ